MKNPYAQKNNIFFTPIYRKKSDLISQETAVASDQLLAAGRSWEWKCEI
jgi:hypothetical protein